MVCEQIKVCSGAVVHFAPHLYVVNTKLRVEGCSAARESCGFSDLKELRTITPLLFSLLQYLSRNGISGITRDNFSFSAKIRVGDFYEAREGPQVTAFHLSLSLSLSLPDPWSSFHLVASKASCSSHCQGMERNQPKSSLVLVYRCLTVHGKM